MVAPYAQATQAGNKCPHGLPVGTCPICSGMGGGSMRKDKDTPRRPGEMTYNECMAAWIKIQAAKDAKIQAKIDRLEAMLQKDFQTKMLANIERVQKSLEKYLQNLENMPKIIQTPIKFVVNNIIMPILNLIAKIPTAIKNIQTFFTNITNFIASVSEKMAMVLGEVKNFIDAQIVQKAKKTIKTILTFFAQGEEESKENEEVEKLKARELKRILKGLFRIRSKAKEEDLEEDEHS